MSRPLRAAQSPAGEPTDGDGATGIGAPRTRSVVVATVASTVVALALVLLTNTALLLLGLLVFLPAFAAALCTPRQTALISACGY